MPFGIGAEIAATVAREGFWDLDAPIERIGAAPTPPPVRARPRTRVAPRPRRHRRRHPPPRRGLTGGRIGGCVSACPSLGLGGGGYRVGGSHGRGPSADRVGEPGVPAARSPRGRPLPIPPGGGPLDDNVLAGLVAEVRASVVRATSAALDELAAALPEPIVSMSLRAWPADSRRHRRPTPCPLREPADSVMYCQVLAAVATPRVGAPSYNAKRVEDEAVRILGDRADACCAAAGDVGTTVVQGHRMACGRSSSPERPRAQQPNARAITRCWISLVPSPISSTLASQ